MLTLSGRTNRMKAVLNSFLLISLYVVYRAEIVLFSYWRDRIRSGLYDGYLIDTPGCTTPRMDPFHASVRHLIVNISQDDKFCTGIDSPVVFRNMNVPFLDDGRLRRLYNITDEVKCFYWEVSRNESSPAPDLTISYGLATDLVFGLPLLVEYIFVICARENIPFYKGYHMLAQRKPRMDKERRNKSSEEMSVLVLGVDSLSRLNFDRHLAQTGSYVREELKAFELLGYNKVGENSYPNQLPLLTGLSSQEASAFSWNKFYDGINALWDVYKKRGHTTLFLEEMPTYGLFVFSDKHGFFHVPTDYYPRPIMQATEYSPSCSRMCDGSRLRSENVLDYILDFVQLMGGEPYFAYLWITDMVHYNANNAGYLDRPLTEFLRKLSSFASFRNTALVFLSDHGIRYGPLILTKIGVQEGKSPFCFLRLPEWFLVKYPKAASSLEVNTRRLTTPYDLHETLLELAFLPNLEHNRTEKGLSLFGEIPSSRSCEDAFIPIQFCACSNLRRSLRIDDVTRSYAQFFVTYINVVAETYFPGKCLHWELKRLEEVEVIGKNRAGNTKFWLNVTTRPEAHFSVYGTLFSEKEKSWEKKIDFVDRLDWYNETTLCLPPSHLKKYCTCKSWVPPHLSRH